VQGTILVLAALFMLLNLTVDHAMDPRLRQ